MAPLIVILVCLAGALQAQDKPKEFNQAGACSRCHVVSVMEWSLSKHEKAGTGCKSCHGESQGHVLDERNNVKPDRIPRSPAAVTALCVTCHAAGCPKSKETANCENCHHMHALLNPNASKAVQDEQLSKLTAKWEARTRYVAEGEKLVLQSAWKPAAEAFRHALEQYPEDRRAADRLRMCERRLKPELPGFEIAGSDFDSATGLPRQVKVAGSEVAMVLAPGGHFDMGSDALEYARPVHTVWVEPFYLGKFEVTGAQWMAVMGTNPSKSAGRPGAESLPVEQVSWKDCQEFVRRLNAKVPGGGFRLPTEAEWEYAARAGSSGAPSSEELKRRAWFRENSASPKARGQYQEIDAYAPRATGLGQPNAWGFHDMLGNVWEWCSSALRPYPFDARDGRESLSEAGLRVVRGGGFADAAETLDPAVRHGERSDGHYRWNGLRLARSVPDSRP